MFSSVWYFICVTSEIRRVRDGLWVQRLTFILTFIVFELVFILQQDRSSLNKILIEQNCMLNTQAWNMKTSLNMTLVFEGGYLLILPIMFSF